MSSCFGDWDASWKHEPVEDHVFSNVNLDAFERRGRRSCMTRLFYFLLFALIGISFFSYVTDILSIYPLAVDYLNNRDDKSLILMIVYSACVAFGFVLLTWEAFKAKEILKSDDIAFVFTTPLALKYASVKSFAKFSLFEAISSYRKLTDKVAIFVFYQLKGWRPLLLVKAPRRGITAYFLYVTRPSLQMPTELKFSTIFSYITTLFTVMNVILFAISLGLTIIAFILYVPLLCHIRGNLKAYCVHKIDKRIARLMRDKSNRRTVLYNDNSNVSAAIDEMARYGTPSTAISQSPNLPASAYRPPRRYQQPIAPGSQSPAPSLYGQKSFSDQRQQQQPFAQNYDNFRTEEDLYAAYASRYSSSSDDSIPDRPSRPRVTAQVYRSEPPIRQNFIKQQSSQSQSHSNMPSYYHNGPRY